MSLNRCPRGEYNATLHRLIAIETDECVLWPYSTMGHGYGRIHIDGISFGTHVVSWCWTHDMPLLYRPGGKNTSDSICICHTCDVKLCVNPRHLFDGNVGLNTRDAASKGIIPFGEKHHQAKLNRNDVRKIRELVASGHEGRIVAKQYGIHEGTVSEIKNRKAWSWLD